MSKVVYFFGGVFLLLISQTFSHTASLPLNKATEDRPGSGAVRRPPFYVTGVNGIGSGVLNAGTNKPALQLRHDLSKHPTARYLVPTYRALYESTKPEGSTEHVTTHGNSYSLSETELLSTAESTGEGGTATAGGQGGSSVTANASGLFPSTIYAGSTVAAADSAGGSAVSEGGVVQANTLTNVAQVGSGTLDVQGEEIPWI